MILPLKLTEESRVLVFAPHPDDETLATGGLLQMALGAGAALKVIFTTDGDNNPWMQRIAERRWNIGSLEQTRWGEVRRREALTALNELGVEAHHAEFWGYPDQGLTKLLLSGKEEPLERLSSQIGAWRPTLLVIPSLRDLHPDHNAFAVLIHLARMRLPSDQPPHTILSYVIHSHGVQPFTGNLIEIPLNAQQQERKKRALLCHATQLQMGRRRFLRFVTGSEKFIPVPTAGIYDPDHPIQPSGAGSNTLRLCFSSNPYRKPLGRRFLYLAGGSTSGPGMGLAMPLPSKPASVPLLDTAAQKVVQEQAEYRGGRRKGMVNIPLSVLHPQEKLFAKHHTQCGFFDEAGWVEIPAVGSHAEETSRVRPKSAAICETPSVCCVIPCYNVAAHCEEVVRQTSEYADLTIVVDDGSTDETGAILRRVAAESHGRIRMLSFERNHGKGVALIKGFKVALEQFPFHVLVTLDGDRQHRPADIPRVVSAVWDKQAAMVIGERTAELSKVPLRSRIGNSMATWILKRYYPSSPNDTQSGLRGFQRDFVQEIVRRVKGGRYETESTILLLALESGKKIVTVPIHSIYLDRNSSSHFRPVADALRISRALHRFRKLASRSLVNKSGEFFLD